MGIIFLVGARAAGKTTLGAALARRLGLPFADTDQELSRRAGRSVAEVVAAEGWSRFRERETDTLRAVAAALAAGGVIATGGGMVLAEGNRRQMRSTGTVLYLHAPAAVLAQRLAANPLAAQRPSLTGRDPAAEMAAVLAERHPLYLAAAHHVLDATLPVDALCEAALSLPFLSRRAGQ